MPKTMKDIVRNARKFYPNSKSLRRQYVGKTAWLISVERHALMTGGWRVEWAK